MVRHSLVLLAFMLLTVSNMVAQVSLSGYVKSATDGETLIGASVVIYPVVNGVVINEQTLGTVTNEYGFYSISIPRGQYKVECSYIGYQSIKKELSIKESTSLGFDLTEGFAQLEVVVVTAEDRKSQTTDIGVETLKAETLEQLPALLGEPDVIRSIQLLPGVSSVNEASSGFNVRGGAADQNLVLLDDGVIYNASHLFGLFSVFNFDAIKTATLYKGGIPAIYGGRLSSVLDVQQREGNKNNFAGKATVGLISSKLSLEGPLAKKKENSRGSYLVAARRSYADLFTSFISEFRGNTAFFYDLNVKTNYQLDDQNKLFLSGYFGRDRFNLSGLVGTSWGNASGTLRWTSILNDQLFFQLSGILSNYDYSLDVLRSGSELRWSSSIRNFNLKPRLSWFVSPNNTIRIGLDVMDYQFNPADISPLKNSPVIPTQFQSKKALEGAAFIDLEQSLNEKLKIRYGLRGSMFYRLGASVLNEYADEAPLVLDPATGSYTQNEIVGQSTFGRNSIMKTYTGFEPRLSLNYELTRGQSIKAGYNRMYQYLHLISNTTSPTPLDIWTPSDIFLEPQRADQVSIGYTNSSVFKSVGLTVETFYKQLDNVTNFVDGADLLFTENLETEVIQGKGQAYGLELLIEKNVGKLTGWLAYTLARSEQEIPGINNGQVFPTNYDQTHELNIVGAYQLNPRWEFSGSWVFGSGRPVTYPSGRYMQNGLVVTDYSTRNANRLPAYHRLDLSAKFCPKPNSKAKGTWIFSVINAYNRQNAASIFFRELSSVNDVEKATGLTEAVRLSYFGIVPSVSYQFNFGKKQ
ncbi:MAG: TonB-dependent receptor [Saprospiraceae bacterium]|nr:TonB-dependent receptor [Saprospiraceae bacterium]